MGPRTVPRSPRAAPPRRAVPGAAREATSTLTRLYFSVKSRWTGIYRPLYCLDDPGAHGRSLPSLLSARAPRTLLPWAELAFRDSASGRRAGSLSPAPSKRARRGQTGVHARALDAAGTRPRPAAQLRSAPLAERCRVRLRGCRAREPSAAGGFARRVGGRPRRAHGARGSGNRAGVAGGGGNRSFLPKSHSPAGAVWEPAPTGPELGAPRVHLLPSCPVLDGTPDAEEGHLGWCSSGSSTPPNAG